MPCKLIDRVTGEKSPIGPGSARGLSLFTSVIPDAPGRDTSVVRAKTAVGSTIAVALGLVCGTQLHESLAATTARLSRIRRH